MNRLKKRAFLLGAALVCGIHAQAQVAGGGNAPAGPQILTLPNGLRYQFAGVTLDTQNVPPSLEADLVSSLPKPLESLARQYAGTKITQFNADEKFATPYLFVWFRRLGTNAPASSTIPTLTARLTDQGGVAAGVSAYAAFADGIAWSYAEFPAFPRRSRVIQCDLYPFGGGNSAIPVSHISFPNPFYGDFPKWHPEPIPTVKMAGDLEVRLDDFTTGGQDGGDFVAKANGSRGLRYRPAGKGQNTTTAFDVSLTSPRGTNETWVLNSAELSDATGNVLRNNSFQSSINLFRGYVHPPPSATSAYSETIRGMLWPDEPAWRLRLEVKRAAGFGPGEIVTFKNVPVPAVGTTNTTPMTNMANGIQIVLTKFARRPDITVNAMGMYNMTSQVSVELPGKPAGVALDFLNMTTDAGKAEQYGSSTADFSYTVDVKTIPANAKTMDFSWVVQRTRVVDFLVKPPNAK